MLDQFFEDEQRRLNQYECMIESMLMEVNDLEERGEEVPAKLLERLSQLRSYHLTASMELADSILVAKTKNPKPPMGSSSNTLDDVATDEQLCFDFNPSIDDLQYFESKPMVSQPIPAGYADKPKVTVIKLNK